MDATGVGIVARHRDAEGVGRAFQRPALDHQRGEHDHEGDVEVQPRIRQLRQQRDRRQEDADGAAQPDPGNEADLAPAVAERYEAQHGRGRPRDEHQERGDAQRRPHHLDQRVRRGEQAEQQEHHQLREPGRRVLHRRHLAAGAHRAVGDDHPGRVHREIAAAADQVGEREQRHRAGHRQPRMEAGREVVAVERGHDQAPAAIAHQRAAAHRPHHLQGDRQRAAVLAGGDPAGQGDGQEHRHRVVGAGFDFQGAAGAAFQVQAAGADQEEHGGGVGRGQHGAEQQRLQQRQFQQGAGGDRGQRGGDQHAEGREHQRGPDRGAHLRRARLQAAVEQDQAERERADLVGEAGIVVVDAAGTVDPEQQAEDEEDQQQRRAEAPRQQRRADAGQHQDGVAEQAVVDVMQFFQTRIRAGGDVVMLASRQDRTRCRSGRGNRRRRFVPLADALPANRTPCQSSGGLIIMIIIIVIR